MSESPRSTSSLDSREIRVFISSTFQDMMRERDLLVKEVFPELRRKCAKRFVTFTEVDLRWGITEGQANEGQVLPLCLAEIERSRPYFIGLLGERYGWIPDTIRPEIIERELWLKEHEGRASVTELEIRHGVLNNPKMQSHAFFYFRDSAYATHPTLAADERRDMIERNIKAEVEQYGEAEATRRTEERKAKLAALKQCICDSKLPLARSYADPKALADIVRQQFDELIDRLYPEDEVPDLLAQERLSHEAHAKNKLFACIDRPVHLAALNAFAEPVEHSGQGLVVTGESGAGKTALLAAWARDWAKNHPEGFIFQHYFGATPGSASPEGFLRRLLGELKSRFGVADDIPTDPEKLRDTLQLWLAQTIGKAQVVLVLDGLNLVQGSKPESRLRFLPRHFPPHVVALSSALSSPALDALCERGWAEHDLPRASEAEVDAMVGEYLTIHARTLEDVLRNQLVTAHGTKNPLFLRTVLEELRQFGSFEQLPQRVSHYLEADNPKDLFLRVLTRWQEDFDGKDPEQDKPRLDLVRRSLTHLWAARLGLSEPEWCDLLGDASRPLPRALWTPLFLALEPHLSQRAGLFAFGHDFLRQAVEAAFVPTGDLQQISHLSVGDYFECHSHQQEMTPRKAAEWPHQLHAAEAWERLEACLTDIPLFLALYQSNMKWELTRYWHPLRQIGRDMGNLYIAAHRRVKAGSPLSEFSAHVSTELGSFLWQNGCYREAQILLRHGMESHERVLGPEHPDTLTSVNNLAVLLGDAEDFASAEALYRRALEARERVLGKENLETLETLNGLAVLMWKAGKHAEAESLCDHALERSQRVLGSEHPHTLKCMHTLGTLLGDTNAGDNRAESIFRRVLQAKERTLGREHPDTLASMHGLGVSMWKTGKYAAAESLCRRASEETERVLGPEHPDTVTSLLGLATVLSSRGDYAEAEPIFRRALEAAKRILGPEHTVTLVTMENLAFLLGKKGGYAEAERLRRRVFGVRKRVLGPNHPHTLLSVRVNLLAWLLEFALGLLLVAAGIALVMLSAWFWLICAPLIVFGFCLSIDSFRFFWRWLH